MALWYLYRLCELDPAFCPTPNNVHRLLITALVIASKASDDTFHSNNFMATCGGIPVRELNKLELHMCSVLEWHLLPTGDELSQLVDAVHDPSADLCARFHCFSNARAGGRRMQAEETTPPREDASPVISRARAAGRAVSPIC